jgi:hypothetical protein
MVHCARRTKSQRAVALRALNALLPQPVAAPAMSVSDAAAHNVPLVVNSVDDIRAAMTGEAAGGSWSLSPADLAAIERLPSIYAYCFDSVQSDLAAELYAEDAELHMGGPPAIGKDAIRKSFEGQARLRANGKMRLRSRHHMSNVVICPDPATPGLAHCVAYMINFRNPDSDHPFNDGPPEALSAPAFATEYRFDVTNKEGGVWKILRCERTFFFAPVYTENRTFAKTGSG